MNFKTECNISDYRGLTSLALEFISFDKAREICRPGWSCRGLIPSLVLMCITRLCIEGKASGSLMTRNWTVVEHPSRIFIVLFKFNSKGVKNIKKQETRFAMLIMDSTEWNIHKPLNSEGGIYIPVPCVLQWCSVMQYFLIFWTRA